MNKLILNLVGSTDHLNVVGRIELEKQFQRFYVQRFKEQSKKIGQDLVLPELLHHSQTSTLPLWVILPI